MNDHDVLTAVEFTFASPLPVLRFSDAYRIAQVMLNSGDFVDVRIESVSDSSVTISGFETAWLDDALSEQRVLDARFPTAVQIIANSKLSGIIKNIYIR